MTNFTQSELDHIVYKAAKVVLEVIKQSSTGKPRQSCVLCANFDSRGELCKLGNVRPPAQIIAFGCEFYIEEDDIPF